MFIGVFSAIIVLTAGLPIWVGWRASKRTALAYALLWTSAAWLTWTISAWIAAFGDTNVYSNYLALCLTACAIVAVLGARRPNAGPWNFVVVGLLCVTSLPIAQRHFAGAPLTLGLMQILLLGGIFVVGTINYSLTRLGTASALLLLGCGVQLYLLHDAGARNATTVSIPFLLIGFAAWSAFWTVLRAPAAASAFDSLWFSFRDRWGLVWGQRLREQFNHSAEHAAWPAVLTWKGLRRKAGAGNPNLDVQEAMLETLRALMQRFV